MLVGPAQVSSDQTAKVRQKSMAVEMVLGET
jgi:hypothetical protein